LIRFSIIEETQACGLTPRSSGPDPALRAGRSAELRDVRRRNIEHNA
jgi:hypothetical protein